MEKYIKVYIKSKADLPDGKGENKYFAHSTISKISLIECSLTDLIWGNGVYDYYLQPISDTELIVPNLDEKVLQNIIDTLDPHDRLREDELTIKIAKKYAKWAIAEIKKLNK